MASLSDGARGARTDDAESADGETPEVETAIARIRERGDEVARRERNRALDRLRARDSLSEREEEAVAALADRLADRLLAVPEESLRATEDGEVVRVALELFGED